MRLTQMAIPSRYRVHNNDATVFRRQTETLPCVSDLSKCLSSDGEWMTQLVHPILGTQDLGLAVSYSIR